MEAVAARHTQLLAALRMLGSGAPPSGAQVLLQSRAAAAAGRHGEGVTETMVAEGVTGPEGQCLLPAAFAQGAARALQIRALYRGTTSGAGACVSPAVTVHRSRRLQLPRS